MAKQMFLSVLYNIVIFIALYTVYWGFTHARYDFLTGAVIVAGIFIYLKIQQLKKIRNMERPVKK